jgi:hypothetical protein
MCVACRVVVVSWAQPGSFVYLRAAMRPQILRLRSRKATFAQDDQDGFRFEVSHPSDKNKDVARMGHPKLVIQAPHDQEGFRFEVSHPSRKKQRRG